MTTDFTELRNVTMMYSKLFNSYLCFWDTNDTLYFDETGNVKKFRLKADSFNNDSDTHFVLGGVEAKTTVTFDELKQLFHLQNNATEVKSTTIFSGDFKSVLNHRNLENFLKFVDDKDWHIHFTAVNLLYYSLVDIIDSIFDYPEPSLIFIAKAVLYEIMKRDVTGTASLLCKYNYPDLKDEDTENFCDDMISLINRYSQDFHKREWIPVLTMMILAFNNAKSKKKLIFIQDETAGELVNKFDQFYLPKIYLHPYATLVFDHEAEIQAELSQMNIIIDGMTVNNYSMVDSKNEPMIQVCDIIVALISRYLKFIDSYNDDAKSELSSLNHRQASNLKLLNKLLNKSLNYNACYRHYIAPINQIENFDQIIKTYI